MPGIGAGGFVGIAHETVSGTYLAPVLYVPVMNESIGYVQDTIWRRPIRQSADVVGAVAGNARVEGDISMEAFENAVAYFMHVSRAGVTKTGTASPGFTYVFKGNSNAIPSRTMSITVIRNGIVFGYTGCVVSSFSFTIEDGLLMFNVSILGRDEATQSLPTATWTTGIQATVFGAGFYSVEIPTATQVFDCDGFEFTVEDNAEAQYRLKNTGQGAQYINYGERNVNLSFDRDFENRTDYDAFKALTAQTVTVTASKGANNKITILVPVAIKDTYEVGLGGQGELIRAAIAYQGVLNTTGEAYVLTVLTQLDIT